MPFEITRQNLTIRVAPALSASIMDYIANSFISQAFFALFRVFFQVFSIFFQTRFLTATYCVFARLLNTNGVFLIIEPRTNPLDFCDFIALSARDDIFTPRFFTTFLPLRFSRACAHAHVRVYIWICGYATSINNHKRFATICFASAVRNLPSRLNSRD